MKNPADFGEPLSFPFGLSQAWQFSHFVNGLECVKRFMVLLPTFSSPSTSNTSFSCKAHSKRNKSQIYSLLNSYQATGLETLKRKWKTDLVDLISDRVWHKILQNIFSSSVCFRPSIVQFKTTHCLYWSKDRLSKIKTDLDPTCDWC